MVLSSSLSSSSAETGAAKALRPPSLPARAPRPTAAGDDGPSSSRPGSPSTAVKPPARRARHLRHIGRGRRIAPGGPGPGHGVSSPSSAARIPGGDQGPRRRSHGRLVQQPRRASSDRDAPVAGHRRQRDRARRRRRGVGPVDPVDTAKRQHRLGEGRGRTRRRGQTRAAEEEKRRRAGQRRRIR